ncbi:MAG: PilZ domain-containing protein, partial [Terracidiphilus sp.]
LVPLECKENSGTVNMALSGLWMASMEALKSALPLHSARSRPAPARQEVRCAVRFPLSLPVLLSSGKEEIAAMTRNVSASGVVFELDSPVQKGLEIHFSLRMPGAILGTPHDVLVHCQGRVVRCSKNQSNYQAAATIDDYQFAEQ